MHLRYLEYLTAVIEHGSFAAAAQVIGVSQPAISHGLRTLQKHFDAPLLRRSGRRSIPTALALQVASEGAALADRVEALAAAAPRRSNPNGLRVGLTPSAAVVCGPALYDAWCRGHPRRTLALSTVDEGRLLSGLRRREFDLVIAPRPRRYDPSGLDCQPLYQLQPRVYARSNHPLAGAQTLAALQTAAWACVGPSVRGPVDVLSEAFAVRRMAAPRVTANCPDFTSMLKLVAHTDLLAVVPHAALLSGDLRKQIAPLRLRETLPLYEMWWFHPARSPRVAGVLAALRHALEAAALGDLGSL
ncbi:LysR family transcriptional regulator [Ideonella sp. B508-1]|uniref:LysR family transcriptional regulator n=1 Tax=Ideonella sp. B508-1 TaxID=137716 RepID=UPI0003463473|nr:LysR family transcriptional regulator [Ideonella sp. B508-1]